MMARHTSILVLLLFLLQFVLIDALKVGSGIKVRPTPARKASPVSKPQNCMHPLSV